MKRTLVQCAEVTLQADADPAAPGGAVTVALCGSWDHAGACRWPHHTSAEWDERRGRVRVVFVVDPEEADHVRALIEQALAKGECLGPDGKVSRWKATEHSPGIPTVSEEVFGANMAGLPGAE
jgi:hypothetical protein